MVQIRPILAIDVQVLEQIKEFLKDTVGLPAFVVQIGMGLSAHVALNLLLHKPLTSAHGLLLPLILGVSIETYEIWIQYRDVGLFTPGNDPLLVILARHLGGVALVLVGPVALVIYGMVASR